MSLKSVTALSKMGLRSNVWRHQGVRAFATLKQYYGIQKTLSLNTNLTQRKVAFYSTKLPVQVLPSNYEEVKDLPNHPEKLLIDVREPAELKKLGVIPTSINIPLATVKHELSASQRDDAFKAKYGREKPHESTEIIFHCYAGKRSAMAAETAVLLGYTNVRNYEGSWLDWAEHEGLPK